jgi:hypothetical protein
MYYSTLLADKPLIVYLASDLTLLLSNLLNLFVKSDVMRANTTGFKLANFEVEKKNNHIAVKKINIGNASKLALASSNATELQKRQFYDECFQMMCALVSKIQERCPLKYSIVRAFAALDPQIITDNNDAAVAKFSIITKKLVVARIKTSGQCDKAEREFRRMIREKADIFKNYDPKDERLDEFCHGLLDDKEEFRELWNIVQLIMVLSHGQATVERGFSVNDDMLLPNIKKESLIGQRIVFDTMKSLNMKLHEFKITENILKYCR